MASRATLARVLGKRHAGKAQRVLFDLLRQRLIHPTDCDGWGPDADRIDRLFIFRGRVARSLSFWRGLLRLIRQAEASGKVHIYKGLILFRIGVRRLLLGHQWSQVERYLSAAYREDKLLYPTRGQDPEEQSAFRLLTILRLLHRFARGIGDQSVKSKMSQVLTLGTHRVGREFLRAYDWTLETPRWRALSTLPTRSFRRLVGVGRAAAMVQADYLGADYLVQRRAEYAKTNLQKYGIARAIIVLCGSAVEGVLAGRKHLIENIPKNKRSLGSLSLNFLKQQRVPPEVAAALVFIWFARNLIHPAVLRRHRSVLVDLDLAEFIFVLTERVLHRLERRSRRRG